MDYLLIAAYLFFLKLRLPLLCHCLKRALNLKRERESRVIGTSYYEGEPTFSLTALLKLAINLCPQLRITQLQ